MDEKMDKINTDYIFYNDRFNIIYLAAKIQFFPWLNEYQLMIEFDGNKLYDVSPSEDICLGEL